MSAEVGVISRLEEVAAVTALVSTRIYQGVMSQSPTLPSIRVQGISENEPMHLRGSSSLITSRVQIDSVAGGGNPVTDALAVDAAIRGDGSGSSLIGWSGTAGGVEIESVLPGTVRKTYDAEELRQYRVIRDVFVTWRA